MEERFKNIDPDKRDRIINAAIKEFAANGYDKASTNVIVKNAGISRGLLYHYFVDKQDLYDALLKYSVFTFVNKIEEAIDWSESDIFERLKQITFVKISVAGIYPDLFNFLVKVFITNNMVQTMDEIYDFYEKLGLNVKELFQKVYQENIDYSKFREPDKIKINMDIIRWTIEKWAEEILQSTGENFTSDDMDIFGDQIDEYISVLKKAFY